MKILFIKQRGVLTNYSSNHFSSKDADTPGLPLDANTIDLIHEIVDAVEDVRICFIPENTKGWFERSPEKLTVFAPHQEEFNALFTSGKQYPDAITEYINTHPEVDRYVVITSSEDYVKCKHPSVITDLLLGITVYESHLIEYYLSDSDMTVSDIIMHYFDSSNEDNPGKLLIKNHQTKIIARNKKRKFNRK